MSGKLDQSLDEILSTQRRGGGNRRSTRDRRPTAGRATTTTAPVGGVRKSSSNKPVRGNAAKNAAKSAPSNRAKSNGESKIIVSNLPRDVAESQIKEYFRSAVGPVKRAEVAYGPGGVSRGIANVTFADADGASQAFKRLNGILVDNRPIKVEVVVTGDMVAQPKSLSQRITQPKAQPKPAAADKSGKGAKGAKPDAAGKAAATKKGRGGRGKNGRPVKKTAEELDSEMADYFDAAKTDGAAPATGDAAMDDGMDAIL